MIAERSKDFEQVPDALARQIVRRGRDHLINRIQIGQECLPTGTASANGRAIIVDVGSNYDGATVLDCLPEIQANVHLGARTNGLPVIYRGADHGQMEPQNSDTSTKLTHIFMPLRAALLAIDRRPGQACRGCSEALRRPRLTHRPPWVPDALSGASTGFLNTGWPGLATATGENGLGPDAATLFLPSCRV